MKILVVGAGAIGGTRNSCGSVAAKIHPTRRGK
jgi:hypothetical protein